MKFINFNAPLEVHPLTFKKPFDDIFITFKQELVEDTYGKKMTDSDLNFILESHLNSFWDGKIYWLPQELGEKFHTYAQSWFEKNSSKFTQFDEEGFSNVMLISKTKTGYAFIDSQYNYTSSIENLWKSFVKEYAIDTSTSEIVEFSHRHLTDFLVLSKEHSFQSNHDLIKLYQEGLLSDGLFFHALDEFYPHIKTEKQITLTGTFFAPKADVYALLEEAGLHVNSKLQSNSVLWLGDNPHPSTLEKAKQLGVETVQVSDLISNLNLNLNIPSIGKK